MMHRTFIVLAALAAAFASIASAAGPQTQPSNTQAYRRIDAQTARQILSVLEAPAPPRPGTISPQIAAQRLSAKPPSITQAAPTPHTPSQPSQANSTSVSFNLNPVSPAPDPGANFSSAGPVNPASRGPGSYASMWSSIQSNPVPFQRAPSTYASAPSQTVLYNDGYFTPRSVSVSDATLMESPAAVYGVSSISTPWGYYPSPYYLPFYLPVLLVPANHAGPSLLGVLRPDAPPASPNGIQFNLGF